MVVESMSWYKTELPPGKVDQLDTDIDALWEGTGDIGFGPRFLGEIRKGQWHCELGGPKHSYKSFVYSEVVENPDDVVDGKVEIIGPELNDLAPETSLPFVQHLKLWGPLLNEDHTEFAARSIATGWIQTEGCGWIGSPDTVWLRISKAVAPRLSFRKICQIIRANAMTECPLVEKVEIKLIIGSPEVGGIQKIEELIEELKPKWDALQAKHGAVADEDVELFYGCTLCKMIAPNHACLITPAVVPYCGVLSFYTCKAIYDTDPFGYVFSCPKGEVLDPIAGRYSGVDEVAWEKSDHKVKRFNLHSAIKYPTTNCGCFEAAVFYIPQVDGLGVAARRNASTNTPIGMSFSKIAGIMSGGVQNHGFKGISYRSVKSPKFVIGDGGWDRIVWMQKDMKTELADAIPEEVYDKIATEDDCIDPGELEIFLREKRHPITRRFWKDEHPVPLKVPLPGREWPQEENSIPNS